MKKELMEEQDKIKEIEIHQKQKKEKKEEDPVIIEEDNTDKIVVTADANKPVNTDYEKSKGDYKRELNNLITASDVVIQVLDARDPYSYRSRGLENNVITQKKKLIFILNKTDLVRRYLIFNI
jgi:predicted GTPase